MQSKRLNIAIIGAMEEEIAPLEAKMSNKKEHVIASTRFIEGELENHAVILLKSGVGKVNAAMSTTILQQEFNPHLIINVGSAGSLVSELKIGDIVVSEEIVHHDVDATAINYEIGQLPGMPARYYSNTALVLLITTIMNVLGLRYQSGLIGSGDSFVANQTRVNQIKKHFPTILAIEMEAAAIAQVATQYGTPFVVIRAISDIPNNESPIDFAQYLNVAAENSASIVLELLKIFNQ